MHVLVTSLVAFSFGFVGSMPLTGPVAVVVVSRSVQKQFGLAIRIGLGAAFAEALYAGVAFWGFATFLTRHPMILPVTRGVSAVVLGVIGLYFARWKVSETGPGPEKAHRFKGFLLGFSLSALNPTLLATWSAAVAVLYARQIVSFSVPLAIPFGLAAGGGVAAWELVLVALIRRHHHRFPRRALTWTVRALGILLVVIAAVAAVDFIQLVGQRR